MTNQEFIKSVSLEGEAWKEIEGFEGYAVSSFGRVLSLGEPYTCGKKVCKRKPHFMASHRTIREPGYLHLSLTNVNKQTRPFLIHRLVATAFVPNPNNYPVVNHKDEDPFNNRADNLEWCTQQYNCNYGTHNARMAKTISQTAYQKQPVVQLTLNGDFVNSYSSIKEAAISVQSSRSPIYSCCVGKTEKSHGFKWMYLSNYEKLVSMSKNS